MQRHRKAICVLGMHRSGTSSVTKGIHEMGAYIGAYARLVPPDVDNPRGFWEHKRIVELHDAALQALGLRWDTVTPIPRSWFRDPKLDAIRIELRDLIIEEFGEQDLWVWKDPRSCILLPLWEDVLAEMNIEMKYLLVIRNPIDVATSLLRRNGFSPDKSMALWLNYTLSALRNTTKQTRMMIDYDDYLRSWQPCLKHVSDTLAIPWPTEMQTFDARMNFFLSADLQHSRSEFDEVMRSIDSSLVKELYTICRSGIHNANWMESNEFTSHVERMSNEYTTMFHMFVSERSQFQLQCQSRIRSHGDGVTTVETQGWIDDDFHEYDLDLSGLTGSQLSIVLNQFSGLFDLAEIELQYRTRPTASFETVYKADARSIQGLEHTALSMTFPNGNIKFLNVKGVSQFTIPYILQNDGQYSLRFIMRAYRENHPVYTNVIRELCSLISAR